MEHSNIKDNGNHKTPLWVAFWIYYFVGTFSLTLVSKLILLVIVDRETIINYGFLVNPYWYIFSAAIIQAIYFLWAWSKVWLNAFNSSKKEFGYVARVCTSIHAIYSYALILRSVYISSAHI